MFPIPKTAGFALILVVVICTGCGAHLEGTTVNVYEGVGYRPQVGTLVLVEAMVPLSRGQALSVFRPVDLQAAGLKESDVSDGTAVFVSPHRQIESFLSPAHGLYALVSPELRSVSAFRANGAWGGDAVAIRVTSRPPGSKGEPVLYVIERVVEPSHKQGDCKYLNRPSGRQALWSKKLESEGWTWEQDLFVLRPSP
jgi:hypothetical protein